MNCHHILLPLLQFTHVVPDKGFQQLTMPQAVQCLTFYEINCQASCLRNVHSVRWSAYINSIHYSQACFIIITSPPQSYLRRVHCYPHVCGCTLPLCVLAVACTMHNEALTKRCASLWNVIECYRMLQSIAGHYGTLWERYRAPTERYGTVTENIDFAHH